MDSHSKQPWHARPLEDAFTALNTSEDGLSDAEADQRLKTNGRNELRQKPPKSVLHMLKEQITDPMVLILIGAAVFSAVLREWAEAGVIFAIGAQRRHRHRPGEKGPILPGSPAEDERSHGKGAAPGGGEHGPRRRTGGG